MTSNCGHPCPKCSGDDPQAFHLGGVSKRNDVEAHLADGERVLTPNQNAAFERLLDLLDG